MSAAQPLRDRIEREAEMQDLELDSIERVENDSPGTTMRILLEDAEDEADQVGFQVTKPPGQLGEQMFSDRLDEGIRKLARLSRGEDPAPDDESQLEPDPAESDGSAETETSDDSIQQTRSDRSDETTSTERQPNPERSGSKQVPLETFDFTVEMDEGSLSDVREQLTAALEAYDERSVDQQDVAELEARLDDVESRIDELESTLSMLGQFGGGSDDE